jgi:hypothetical protein
MVSKEIAEKFTAQNGNWQLNVYVNDNGLWTFTGNGRSEEENSLVAGIDDMLDMCANGANELTLQFSEKDMDIECIQKISLSLIKDGSEDIHNKTGRGNIYYCNEFEFEGWLCPVLFDFFEVAPDNLFIYVLN